MQSGSGIRSKWHQPFDCPEANLGLRIGETSRQKITVADIEGRVARNDRLGSGRNRGISVESRPKDCRECLLFRRRPRECNRLQSDGACAGITVGHESRDQSQMLASRFSCLE